MAKFSYPIESLAVCTNVKCQDRQDGLLNFVLQGCIMKPNIQNGQRYLVPQYRVKVNCAHCNKEITKDQVPSGAEIIGLPYKAVAK